MTVLLEVCVDDARGLDAAVEGGADRIELCSALSVGGLTPSAGLIRLAAEAPIPVYAMIRPRAGGFVYGENDLLQMEAEISAVEAAGLAGIVIGASCSDGRLDEAAIRRLLSVSRLPATLHRAIDLAPDMGEAVETAISLGFERILTSGGAATAIEGMEPISKMVVKAGDRIIIMPGSGITADNAGILLDQCHLGEVHASCSSPDAEGSEKELELGFAVSAPRRTDAAKVKALKARLARS